MVNINTTRELKEKLLTGLTVTVVLTCALQGERVAELILHHARANECQDVPQFKKEMSQLVDNALSNTLSLGKVII